MARKKKYEEERVEIHARIPKTLYTKLWELAKQRDISTFGLFNKMINEALEEYVLKFTQKRINDYCNA